MIFCLVDNMMTLCDVALEVLNCGNAIEKANKSSEVTKLWLNGEISYIGLPSNMPMRPQRPDKPELLSISQMPKRRKAGSEASKIALLHAIAHIELNAIDLAWDIVARFAHYSEENAKDGFSMPREFFNDWVKVGNDEARHFLMLECRLNDFGATYGDLPAHDGLWEASMQTSGDLPARLAVVPMVLEARGLDVTPYMIKNMKKQGDDKTADIFQLIHDEEIAHVAAGTTWFKHWCDYHNFEVEEHWQHLVKTYFKGQLKPPFNHPSREEAGMIRDWYEPLADIDFSVEIIKS